MKYIVVGKESGPYGTDTRPTQESIKDHGPGEYRLCRADGSISKLLTVSRNRNGNLKLESANPEGIEAISTLNLTRLVRDLGRAVKLLPKSGIARGYRQIVDEIAARATLVAIVAPEGVEDESEDEAPVLAAVK